MLIKKKLYSNLLFFICFVLLTQIFQSNQPIKKIIFSAPRENYCTEKITKTGFIKYIKKKNNKTIIFMDNIEFYLGEDAKKEYFKDHQETSEDEWGHDYYYRNIEPKIIPYELSKDAEIYICEFAINPSTNSLNLVPISVDTLKTYVNNSRKEHLDERAFLFSFQLKDNKITELKMQYTP